MPGPYRVLQRDPDGTNWVTGPESPDPLPISDQMLADMQAEYAGLQPEQPPMGGYGASAPIAQNMSGPEGQPIQAPPPARPPIAADSRIMATPPQPGGAFAEPPMAVAGPDYSSIDAANSAASSNALDLAGFGRDENGNIVMAPRVGGGSSWRRETVREGRILTPEGQEAALNAELLQPGRELADRQAAEAQIGVGEAQEAGYRTIAGKLDNMASEEQAVIDEGNRRADEVFRGMNEDILRFTNREINPNRVFDRNGGAAGVMAAVGVALGTLGSAMTGSPNAAMEIINRAVERDIEAQRADAQIQESGLRSQQNLYGAMLDRIGDDRAARAAVRATQLASVENTIAEMVKAAQNDADKARLEALLLRAQQERAEAQALAGSATFRHVETQRPRTVSTPRVPVATAVSPAFRETVAQAQSTGPVSGEEARQRSASGAEMAPVGDYVPVRPIDAATRGRAQGTYISGAAVLHGLAELENALKDRTVNDDAQIREWVNTWSQRVASLNSVDTGQQAMTEPEAARNAILRLADMYRPAAGVRARQDREHDAALVRRYYNSVSRELSQRMHGYGLRLGNRTSFAAPAQSEAAPLPAVPPQRGSRRAATDTRPAGPTMTPEDSGWNNRNNY